MAMASFRRVILGQPEIASIVFEFQFGVYDDVRPTFRACQELIEYDEILNVYECDASFAGSFAPAWPNGPTLFHASTYALQRDARDARLPLHVAVGEGFVQLAKRIIRCRPDLVSDDALFLALDKGHFEMAEFLLEQRPIASEGPHRKHLRTHSAGRYCFTPILEGDVGSHTQLCCLFPKALLLQLLRREDARGLVLLHRFGLHPNDCSPNDIRMAMQSSTLANATLALDLFPWFHYPRLLDDVAGRGFLPLVRSLHERGFECSTVAMDEAAANGHLEVVRFLDVHRREGCTEEAINDAATNGHLNVVQFLHETRTEGYTLKALDGAIGNGHLDVVQYLYRLGRFDCAADAVDEAASHGHLEAVKFVLSNRMDACTRDIVVQYALEGGHLRTAEYLLSIGFPFPTFDIEFEEDAFHKPEILDVFRLLATRGDPWDGVWMEQACAANNVPLVQFLLEHADGRCGPDVLVVAISHKAWDVVRFLLANETTNISMDALHTLLRRGRLDLAAHILHRHPDLRDDELLEAACASHNTAATQFLLELSIGNPRKCLFQIAGRPKHVTESKLLLSHCMDANNHVDNVLFLLKLYKIPDRHRKTTLQLITQELVTQGQKISQTITLPPSVAACASSLLEAGDVVDRALALVICHLCATDATTTTNQLEKKAAMVQDADLKTQLHRLLASKRKRSTLED